MEKTSKRSRSIIQSLDEASHCLVQRGSEQPSVVLRTLVRQLASIGVPSNNSATLLDLLKSIVLALQKRRIGECDSIRELHGLLFLSLGFLTPSEEHTLTSQADACGTDVVIELLRSTFHVYKNKLYRELILPRERIENYFLILQVVVGVTHRRSRDHQMESILTLCRMILDILLRQDRCVSHILSENRMEIERLLLTLIRIAYSVDGQKASVLDLICFLQCRTEFGHGVNYLATIAADTLKATTRKNTPDTLSTLDQAFYLKCRLIPDQVDSQSLRMLDSLIQQSKSKNAIRLDMIECLYLLKNKVHPCSAGTIVVEALLKCGIDDAEGTDLAYTLILFLLRDKDTNFQCILNAVGFKDLTNFLARHAFQHNELASLPASKALLHIISIVSERFYLLANEERKRIMLITLHLMVANVDESVTIKSVETLELLVVQMFDSQSMHSSDHLQIILALGEAGNNEFAADRVRRGAIRTISTLVQNDCVHIETLSRIPNVLETLVSVASLTEDCAEQKQALAILLLLSENVCDRRILAIQPGLLSSLIGYARSVSQESNGDDKMRDYTKKQVMLIASAL